MPAWRIFYADGSTFSSDDGPPEQAPTFAVAGVVQQGSEGREIIAGSDWYWRRDDVPTWYGGDVHGLLDQAMHLGARWVKQGRTVENDEYRALHARMVDDPDFAPLSDPSRNKGRVISDG